MVSNELVTNSRRNMLETLAVLSSVERQRSYSDAVPFVDVPTELSCQWDQHSSLLHEQQWFRDALAPAELSAVTEFDQEFSRICDSFGRDLPGIEDLWDDPRWGQIGILAVRALEAFT